jgi:hypothetical protein
MGIPFNELNRVLDLGFKPQPCGDIGFLPAKYRPLNQAATHATEAPTGRRRQGIASQERSEEVTCPTKMTPAPSISL